MSPGRKSCGFCTISDNGWGIPFVRLQIDPVTAIDPVLVTYKRFLVMGHYRTNSVR